MKPPRIHVDFEGRSLVDLLKLGADVYARHWSTTPTMLSIVAPHLKVAYVEDFILGVPGHQQCIYPYAKPGDLNFRMIKPPCPPVVLQAIAEGWIFVAHNARFEQTLWYHICHKIWGWPMPTKWSCTAARARYWGLRASLDGAASDLEVLNQKDANGKEFINDFCKPRKYKGAKKLGIVQQLWYEPQENPDGWQRGLHYCLQDSYAEKDVDDLLPDLPPFEQAIWELDFKINTRGLPIDVQSVSRAVAFTSHFTEKAFAKFDEITNLRPTQRDKVLEYINQREEIETLGDLRSKTLKRIVLDDLPADLREVISIRLDTSKASIKKLDTMLKCTDTDGFAKGLFLYGGAHTLRWSAKRIQPQNFTRGDPDTPPDYMFGFLEDDVWNAPAVGHNGGPPLDEMPQQPAWVFEAGLRFIRPLNYLSQSMRGFIMAPKGKKIVAGDYAQIEARVLAWIARCMWLQDAFRRGDDVYSRFAADHMYRDKYDDYFEYKDGIRYVRKPFKRKRQVAKSAVLGCGYGLGKRTFVEYCDNTDLIITEEESEATIRAYREAHPEIAHYDVGLWARVGKAAALAVGSEGSVIQLANTGISYHVHRIDTERYWLLCTLPSGRHIAYYRPKVRLGTKWGRTVEILSFRKEWNGKSYREDTYGGKLCIAEGTRVVTARGLVQIEKVSPTDMLWDGLKWVSHSGLDFRGIKAVRSYFGVSMTPDHEVLTVEGWKVASQSEGLNRAKVRLPNGYGIRRERWGQVTMALPVRLRQFCNYAGNRVDEAAEAYDTVVMRVQAQTKYFLSVDTPRYVKSPCVLGVAGHDRPMHSANPSGVGELRGSGYSRMQRLARLLRELLERHGGEVFVRSNTRTGKQRTRLLERQLQMGDVPRAGEQSQTYCKVYDLMDAGNLHRFTVIGSDGLPLLVHNCENIVQATARDVCAVGALNAEAAGYPVHGLVHDEVITLPDLDFGSHEDLCAHMCRLPAWITDLPVEADGATMVRYGK